MLSKHPFFHILGPSASRIGDKILCITVRVSTAADLITCSCFCKLKAVRTTLVTLMFEFDAFPGTPLKQLYLIPEIV